MNLASRAKREGTCESSLTLQQAVLMFVLFCVCAAGMEAAGLQAAQPAWWTASGGPVNGNPTNDYVAAAQGQLKQFTQKAVLYMNTNLPPGGAGTDLNNLVTGWTNYYATNGYNSTNPAPADLKLVNQGQLKYVGNLVWTNLFLAGYTNMVPTWAPADPGSDYKAGNLGQLKTVFNFDLSAWANVPHITSSATSSGTVGMSYTYTITANNTPTGFNMTGAVQGLIIDTSAGVISGTPILGGTFPLMLSATNNFGTSYKLLTLSINPAPPALPVITSASTAYGTNGFPFSYLITASNIPTGYSAPSLPTGLTVDTTTGLISGTPTVSGTSSVTLGATNAGGSASPVVLVLSISTPPVPIISSGTVATGNAGFPFGYTISASNNPTNFSTSTLPPGLNFNSATGLISGTPTATGTSTVTLGAINARGSASPVNLVLTVNGTGTPIINSPLTTAALQSVPFSYQISANNGPTSFNASSLPTGLTVNTSTGAITGTTTITSTAPIFSTLYASNLSGTGAATLVFTMNPSVPVITSPTSISANYGTAFNYTITANNNPTSFSATGLPSGLNLDFTTGTIFGTPQTSGTYTVALGASNAAGTGSGTLTLALNIPLPVPVITSSTVASGNSGIPFNYTITTMLPLTTSYGAIGLPTGLGINSSTGSFTGSTTMTGSTSVILSATNSAGTGTAILELTINSSSAPLLTSATTATATVGAAFSYTITASGSGITYAATGLPVGLSLNPSTGIISGTPVTIATSNLLISAKNSFGTASTILTLTVNPPVPVITSAPTASGTLGVTISPYQITASNNPTNFAAAGLPPGLFVNPNTGLITGTPAISGNWTVTISGTNAGGSGSANLGYTVVGGLSQPLTTRSVAAGSEHTLLLKSDGTVWAKGFNGYGQLGNGGRASANSFVKVSSLSNVVAIAAEANSSFAITSNGTISAWGLNGSGELGDGTNLDRLVPAPVVTSSGPLSGVIAIAGGEDFAMALLNNGTIWAWGVNNKGQLGNGTITPSGTAVQVDATSLTQATAISCGGSHALAIDSSGNLWSWGSNTYGELGNGMNVDSHVPIQISGMTNVSSIAGGGNGDTGFPDFSIASKSDGTVWSWGDNTYGQLGNNSTTGTLVPITVSSLSGITSVSTGRGGHVVAVKSDGSAFAWGFNQYGQLGNGTTAGSLVPVPVSNLTGVAVIAVGSSHNVAIKNDGTILGWGINTDGQVSAAGPNTQTAVPTTVPGLSGITAIGASKSHSLALKSDGTVWTWGDVLPGQVSDGITVVGSSIPVQVLGLSNVTAVACGNFYNMVLKSDGTVWAWGQNNDGQLGNGIDVSGTTNSGTNVYTQTPQQVTGITGTVTAIACGSEFGMALDTAGYVWAWGYNGDGELGDGSAITRSTAAHISYPALSGTISIVAGAWHGLASSGSVVSWGLNGDLQLGRTTSGTLNLIPDLVTSFSGVTQLSAGYFHSVALKSTGTVWAWGMNDDGQLGIGTVTSTGTPTQTSTFTTFTKLTSGSDSFHSVAMKSDGTVWAWGSNNNGQLGVGIYGAVDAISPTGSASPKQVLGLSGTVIALANGEFTTYALRSDNTVLQWGDNSYEPIGFSVPIVMGNLSQTPSPTILPASGSYTLSQTISMSSPVAGTIFYTLDGSAPTTNSSPYISSFPLSASALVSARVFNAGTPVSSVFSSQYYIADPAHTGLPSPVTGLTVTPFSSSQLNLAWTPASVINYNSATVYRSSDAGVTYQLQDVLPPSGPSTYHDQNVLSGTNYIYYVGTVNASGQTNTAPSSAVSPPATTNITTSVTVPPGATILP